MTHFPESEFGEAVTEWFEDQYGDEHVTTARDTFQPQPYWYPDIVVEADWCVLYIEVENDADSVRPGLAQAEGYAGADLVAGVPLVITPAGHLNPTRAERLRRGGRALIREFDADEGAFVR